MMGWEDQDKAIVERVKVLVIRSTTSELEPFWPTKRSAQGPRRTRDSTRARTHHKHCILTLCREASRAAHICFPPPSDTQTSCPPLAHSHQQTSSRDDIALPCTPAHQHTAWQVHRRSPPLPKHHTSVCSPDSMHTRRNLRRLGKSEPAQSQEGDSASGLGGSVDRVDRCQACMVDPPGWDSRRSRGDNIQMHRKRE